MILLGSSRPFGPKLRSSMIGSNLGCDSRIVEYLIDEGHAWILNVKIY